MGPKKWMSRAVSVGRMRSKTPKRDVDAYTERDYARYQEPYEEQHRGHASVAATPSMISGGYVSVTPSMISGAKSANQHSGSETKKLVVQYALQKNENLHTDENRGGDGTENVVKVKARVENASVTLEECLDIQREEEKRIGRMDRVGRKMHEKYNKKDFFHYITPSSSNIDASDAIGIVSSYIMAYRSLHRTSNRPVHKYDKVLVTKAQGALGRAVIELAMSAGACNVYGVSPAKYHQRISRWGATPLDEDEFMQWSECLMGSVDIVIDIDGGNASSAAAMAANQATGKLVRIFSGPDDSGRRPRSGNNLVRQPANTCDYDIFSDMENDIEGFRSDLQLLFDMVHQGFIKPKKKKAIPLHGMSYIEVKFEKCSDLLESGDTPSTQHQDMGGRNFSHSSRHGSGDADDRSSRSHKNSMSGRSRSSGRSSSRHASRDDDDSNRLGRSRSSGGSRHGSSRYLSSTHPGYDEMRVDDDKNARSHKSNRRERGRSRSPGRSSSWHKNDRNVSSAYPRYGEMHEGARDERDERNVSRSHKSEGGRGRSRSRSRPKLFERHRSKSRTRDYPEDEVRDPAPPPSMHCDQVASLARSKHGKIERSQSPPRHRSRGRSRSLSRPKFLQRRRSKSRTRNDYKDEMRDPAPLSMHCDRSVHSARSRSSRHGDNERSRSSLRGYNDDQSSSRSQSSSGQLKRTKSLPRFRSSENDHNQINTLSYEGDRPWDSGYDRVKSERDDQYSMHYLMRDMSTQSFLLALGKNPNG